jgi:hypothetical protein
MESLLELKNPEEIEDHFMKYTPIDKKFDFESFINDDNLKIKKYKNCYFFGIM